ncbi:MAG: DUF2145 domain-containing protein [Gammaproteobacteria bacterium]|nr:DUF2145 domain-containing protein [Gammaproteobacteria bacterium]
MKTICYAFFCLIWVFSSRFQNCTEYVLDVLNAAIYQTNDIKQLKANASA